MVKPEVYQDLLNKSRGTNELINILNNKNLNPNSKLIKYQEILKQYTHRGENTNVKPLKETTPMGKEKHTHTEGNITKEGVGTFTSQEDHSVENLKKGHVFDKKDASTGTRSTRKKSKSIQTDTENNEKTLEILPFNLQEDVYEDLPAVEEARIPGDEDFNIPPFKEFLLKAAMEEANQKNPYRMKFLKNNKGLAMFENLDDNSIISIDEDAYKKKFMESFTTVEESPIRVRESRKRSVPVGKTYMNWKMFKK